MSARSKNRSTRLQTAPYTKNRLATLTSSLNFEENKSSDKVLYSTANNLVTNYSSYPNRQGTPIRLPTLRRKSRRGTRTFAPSEQFVQALVHSHANIGNNLRGMLYATAMNANIGKQNMQLRIVRHNPGRAGYVINDYHVRETNPGFSRNEFGGRFFTH